MRKSKMNYIFFPFLITDGVLCIYADFGLISTERRLC